MLRPRDERDATAQQVIARLQPRLDAVPGGIAYPVAVQDIQIGARLSTTQYQYTMTDSDAQRLGLWAPRVADRFRRIPGLRDVASDQRDDGVRIAIQVDRDKASARCQHGERGQCALRQFRAAADLHHLWPEQSVPGGDGPPIRSAAIRT